MIFRRVFVIVCFFTAGLLAQDTITGTYTYTYGDSESLVQARQSCKDLALREAIESYYIFVESSTEVDNFQLKEDIIHSISAGYLKNIRIVDQQEEGRTITMTVEASVSAEEVRKVVEELAMSSRSTVPNADEPEAEAARQDTLSDSRRYPFFHALMSYDTRMKAIDNLREQHQYKEALNQVQTLLKALQSKKPKNEKSFQYALYLSVHTHTVLVGELIQVENLESRGLKPRARYRLRQAQQHRDALVKHVIVLDKWNNLPDWMKVVKRKWVSRCRSSIAAVNNKRV